MPPPAVTPTPPPAPPTAAASATVAELAAVVYDELRTLARSQRRRHGASDTINTTAVVHEAYAKLGGRASAPAFADRAHFFRVAARAMRDVIVDYARAQRRAKRGGGERSLRLLDADRDAFAVGALDTAEVLGLHGALGRLERLDAEAARVAELRYFAGLTVEETAEALALSPATVKRRWTVARAWLFRQLGA